MEYLVIKQFKDGNCYIVDPNKLLDINEARSLQKTFQRTDPDHKYIIMRVSQ